MGVTGLRGCDFTDKVASGAKANETRDLVSISGEVDRVYESVTTPKIAIEGGGIEIVKDNFPDVGRQHLVPGWQKATLMCRNYAT